MSERTDTERLDWLDRLFPEDVVGGDSGKWRINDWEADSLREVIDAVMDTEESKR